jgi:hypothetical protein
MLQKREQAPKCGSNEEERKKEKILIPPDTISIIM